MRTVLVNNLEIELEVNVFEGDNEIEVQAFIPLLIENDLGPLILTYENDYTDSSLLEKVKEDIEEYISIIDPVTGRFI